VHLEAGLLGLSAVGFGVYLLAVHQDWTAGAFVVLIGVSMGLPALEPLLVRRERGEPRIDLVAVDGSYQEGLVFPLSRGKQWVRLLMSIALAAFSILITVAIASPSALAVGSLSFAVALFLIWLVAKDLRKPEKVLALLPDGVVTPTWRGPRLVRWDAIEGTAVVRGRYGETFGLVLKKPDSTSHRGFWRRLREPDVALPVDDLVASGDEFRETLERCLAVPDTRASIGLENGPTFAPASSSVP